MHALGLPSRFAPRRSPKRLSFVLPNHLSRHILREGCLFLLAAVFAVLVSSPQAAHASSLLSRSPAKVVATITNASSQPRLRPAKVGQLRPLIPLGGLPMFPAVLLWFPETDHLSDVQVVGVQSEPGNPDSKPYRWLRIGILVLFGMGLLGMLFG